MAGTSYGRSQRHSPSCVQWACYNPTSRAPEYTMSRLVSSSFALVLAACIPSCGSESPPEKQKPGGAGDGKFDPPSVTTTPATPAPDSTGTAGGFGDDNGGDTQAWESDGEDPDTTDGGLTTGDEVEATGGQPELTGHAGPCKVTWSSGTVVRFKYTSDTGGTVEVDADGNGKAEVCGSFTLADGKTTKVSIDNECDDKVDLELTTKYLDDLNLVTAKLTDKKSGKKSDLTLVALPSFSGLIPGYPMHAAKRKIALTDRDGLVRTANVKKPSEGPTVKVRFFYDGRGRIKTVKEDQGSDGSVDQRYDYRYDADGNVKRVTLTQTVGELSSKTTAKLDYSCWK